MVKDHDSMSTGSKLTEVASFGQLLTYLRDELDWPIDQIAVDELTFEYDPCQDLGLSVDAAARVQAVKQLRPLSDTQSWGIFYVEFEPRYVPLRLLERILKALVTCGATSRKYPSQKTWRSDDLLFVSVSGQQGQRRIDFAHFARKPSSVVSDIRVLGWDPREPQPKLGWVEAQLRRGLRWPGDSECGQWARRWRETFLKRPGRERGAWVDLDETSRKILVELYAAADLTVDALPYTADFDWMSDAFNQATGLNLTSHDFWRALSSARKTSQLPRKQR